MYADGMMTGEEYLEHHGIKGQKWGIRRFQNPDGSLTALGKKRLYRKRFNEGSYEYERRLMQDPGFRKYMDKASEYADKSASLRNQMKQISDDIEKKVNKTLDRYVDESKKAYPDQWADATEETEKEFRNDYHKDALIETEGVAELEDKYKKTEEAYYKTNSDSWRYAESVVKEIGSDVSLSNAESKSIRDVLLGYAAGLKDPNAGVPYSKKELKRGKGEKDADYVKRVTAINPDIKRIYDDYKDDFGAALKNNHTGHKLVEAIARKEKKDEENRRSQDPVYDDMRTNMSYQQERIFDDSRSNKYEKAMERASKVYLDEYTRASDAAERRLGDIIEIRSMQKEIARGVVKDLTNAMKSEGRIDVWTKKEKEYVDKGVEYYDRLADIFLEDAQNGR